jgi:hypothetical protein
LLVYRNFHIFLFNSVCLPAPPLRSELGLPELGPEIQSPNLKSECELTDPPKESRPRPYSDSGHKRGLFRRKLFGAGLGSELSS